MLLAMVYNNHGEALEWDMFQIWGYDINNPDLTVRRLWNFYSRLPNDSETLADIVGVTREARNWDGKMHMLANIVDALQAVDWHLVAAFSKNKPKPPKPFKRPKVVRETTKTVWPGKTVVTPKEPEFVKNAPADSPVKNLSNFGARNETVR